MATLPSFFELITTLGLDGGPEQIPRSPSRPSPYIDATLRVAYRSQSTSSLRETENDKRSTSGRYRYQPYSSGNSKARRGSLPGDEFDRSSSSSSSSSNSPRGSPFIGAGRHLPPPPEGFHSHSEEISSFDHKADTPISSYVRRRTPQASPISPSFPQYTSQDSKDTTPLTPTSINMPFTLPTLPSMSGTLPSISVAANRVHSVHTSPYGSSCALPEIKEAEITQCRPRHYTGTRLSAPHRVEFIDYRNRQIAPV